VAASQEYVITGVDDGKGGLQVGSNADLALVDLDTDLPLRDEDLFYRHKISPCIRQDLPR